MNSSDSKNGNEMLFYLFQTTSLNSSNESSRTILPKSNRQAAHSPPRTTHSSTHVDEQQRRNSPGHVVTEKSQPKTIQENESTHKSIRRIHRNTEHDVLSSSLPRSNRFCRNAQANKTFVLGSTNFDFYPGKPKSLDNPETTIQREKRTLSKLFFSRNILSSFFF